MNTENKCCACGSVEGPFANVLGTTDVVCLSHCKSVETIKDKSIRDRVKAELETAKEKSEQ